MLRAHLLDSGWKETRCAQVCQTGALRVLYVDDDEMKKIVAIEELEALHPRYKTMLRVYYRNLYRFERFKPS